MTETPANPDEGRLLLLLGTMVRDAAHLEIAVESITGHLMASCNPQAASVRGKPLSALLSRCREAARQVARVDATQLDSLDKLLDRVAAVADLRNAYVHGGWVEDDDGSYLAVRGKRGQDEMISHSVSGDQLIGMINEIRSVYSGLFEWLGRDFDVAHGPPKDQDAAEPH